MATAKGAQAAAPSGGPRRSPSRWRRDAAILSLIAAAGALIWFWTPLQAAARADAAYEAQVGCICRYVSGRDLASCRAALSHPRVFLSDDDAEHAVSARALPFARQTSRWDAASGCVLQAWPR